jgi:hypothetical protein
LHPLREIGGGRRGRCVERGIVKEQQHQLGVVAAEHEKLAAGITDDDLAQDAAGLAKAMAHRSREFRDPSGLGGCQRKVIDENPACVLQENARDAGDAAELFGRRFKV